MEIPEGRHVAGRTRRRGGAAAEAVVVAAPRRPEQRRRQNARLCRLQRGRQRSRGGMVRKRPRAAMPGWQFNRLAILEAAFLAAFQISYWNSMY